MKKQQFPLEDLNFKQHKNEYGKIHIPSIDASDSLREFKDEISMDNYIFDFLIQWRYTEVIFDPSEVWSRRLKIVNDDYTMAQSEYMQMKFEWCKNNTNE